jgi:predicted regulator of Ras-like GTPase activity (Roadblock/LC7/MglB family)
MLITSVTTFFPLHNSINQINHFNIIGADTLAVQSKAKEKRRTLDTFTAFVSQFSL